MTIFRTTKDLIEMLQKEDPSGEATPIINGKEIVTDVRADVGNVVELISRSTLSSPRHGM